MTPPTPMRFPGGLLPSTPGPPTFMAMDSARSFRWRFSHNPSRSSRYPDRPGGRTSWPLTAFVMEHGNVHLRSSFGNFHAIGCGRCPVDLVCDARYARYHVAGGTLSRRLNPTLFALTMRPLSQARPLGGLHRASPVPFRASYFTPGLHPPGATAQRLTAYWYRQWDFPSIPSPRFVAHPMVHLPRRNAFPS
jgi:hypothetical protein